MSEKRTIKINKNSLREIIRESILNVISCSPVLPITNKVYNIFNSRGLLRENDERLLEGVFKTYPLESIVNHLCEYLNLTTEWKEFIEQPKKYGGFLYVQEGDNKEKLLNVVSLNDEHSLHIIKRCMRMCGYYEASNEEYYNQNFRLIIFEPRKTENTVNKIVQEQEYLYHLTIKSRLDKILKNGLCPRTNMKDEDEYDKDKLPKSISRKNNKNNTEFFLKDNKGKYPSRIYFFLKIPSFMELVYMGQQMFGKENLNNLVLVEVETKGIKNNFYYDPNAIDGIFTEENIKPSSINRIIKLNPYDGNVETLYQK